MNEFVLTVAISAPIGLLLGYVFENQFWSLPDKQRDFLMYAVGSVGASAMLIGPIAKSHLLFYLGQGVLGILLFAIVWLNRTIEEVKPVELPPPPPPEPPPESPKEPSAEEKLKAILEKNRR